MACITPLFIKYADVLNCIWSTYIHDPGYTVVFSVIDNVWPYMSAFKFAPYVYPHASDPYNAKTLIFNMLAPSPIRN